MRWRKVTLLGVGLLGGSLGLALRQRKLAHEVWGYVRRESSIAECLQAGAVDQADTDLAACVADAELLVLCTPLAQMPQLSRSLLPFLKHSTLVTDVGSVKGSLVSTLEPLFAESGHIFVGSHPMAGSEKTGVRFAKADLFQDACCVVTPTSQTPRDSADQIANLWRSVGARTMRLSPELHDRLVSRSSHLPHLVAAHLASYVLDPGHSPEQQKLCANGFKDTTRVASGSPEMWRDIIVCNRLEVRHALQDLIGNLTDFAALLDSADPSAIESFFAQAKARRDSWTAQCSSPSPE